MGSNEVKGQVLWISRGRVFRAEGTASAKALWQEQLGAVVPQQEVRAAERHEQGCE